MDFPHRLQPSFPHKATQDLIWSAQFLHQTHGQVSFFRDWSCHQDWRSTITLHSWTVHAILLCKSHHFCWSSTCCREMTHGNWEHPSLQSQPVLSLAWPIDATHLAPTISATGLASPISTHWFRSPSPINCDHFPWLFPTAAIKDYDAHNTLLAELSLQSSKFPRNCSNSESGKVPQTCPSLLIWTRCAFLPHWSWVCTFNSHPI